MTTECAGGQNLGIRAREEERVATGHAAASTTHAPAGSPAQKESVAASRNKTPLWRKAKHWQSCQGGGKGSYRAWIHPASRGKASRPAQGKRQGCPRGVDPPGKPRRSCKCSKHCSIAERGQEEWKKHNRPTDDIGAITRAAGTIVMSQCVAMVTTGPAAAHQPWPESSPGSRQAQPAPALDDGSVLLFTITDHCEGLPFCTSF